MLHSGVVCRIEFGGKSALSSDCRRPAEKHMFSVKIMAVVIAKSNANAAAQPILGDAAQMPICSSQFSGLFE